MFLYPHLHWWKPNDQNGGIADLPTYNWNFYIANSALCSPMKNLKSKIPPITLNVK